MNARLKACRVSDDNKKLIRRWDSERELSLRRHRTRTTLSISSIRAEAVMCWNPIQWNNAI